MANHTSPRCMHCYKAWMGVYLSTARSPGARRWNAVSVYDGPNGTYWAHCRLCGHLWKTTNNIGFRYSRGPIPGPLPQQYLPASEYEF